MKNYKKTISKLINNIWNEQNLDLINSVYTLNISVDRGFQKSINQETERYFINQIFQSFTTIQYSFEDLIQSNNKVYVKWEYQAKHTKKFLNFLPTGTIHNFKGIDIFNFSSDKVDKIEQFSNIFQLLKHHDLIIKLPNVLSDQIDPKELLINNIKSKTNNALTKREIEALSLWLWCCCYKEVANNLNIAERTAGNHIDNAKAKIFFSNKSQFIDWAYNNDILELCISLGWELKFRGNNTAEHNIFK